MNFKDLKKLHHKKGRDQFGHFLAEGEHLILELQKAARHQPALLQSRLYVTGEHAHWRDQFEIEIVSERQMAGISDTETPQGIIAVVPLVPAPASSAAERAIYLHEVQDPGNLGTILRSLAWFGGFRCLLSPGCVDPHNAKVVRASSGAIFHVAIETDIGLETLPTRYGRIACLDLLGERLPSGNFTAYDCYLFGNEARGLPRELLDSIGADAYTVPGSGAIDSLNLASVVNICAYEIKRTS